MSSAPSPIFVFFGIEGGATCCHVENEKMFVGSQNGKVRVYGIESKVMEQIAYEDEEERRIQSIDFSDGHLFVHIRGYAILQLKSPSWKVVRTFEVDHVGFCNSLVLGTRLLYASSDIQRFPTLDSTLISSESRVESVRIKDAAADVTPMCMTLGEGEREVLVGMEDGKLAVFGTGEQDRLQCDEIINLGREPVFCVASCSKWIAAGCARAPIYLVSRESKEKREIFYPPDSAGCSAITFSPNGKQILAGFWDGTMRVFSCLRLTVLLAISSTHTSTISSLTWRSPEDVGGEVVVATSSDTTVSMWKLR